MKSQNLCDFCSHLKITTSCQEKKSAVHCVTIAFTSNQIAWKCKCALLEGESSQSYGFLKFFWGTFKIFFNCCGVFGGEHSLQTENWW